MIPLSKPFIDKSDFKYFTDIFQTKILTDGKYQLKSEELIKRIIDKDIGPKIDPIAPNKIKSPPPIPSFLENILKIKLINHKEKYPSTKP